MLESFSQKGRTTVVWTRWRHRGPSGQTSPGPRLS